ncbi:LysR family transcriptional regulator [Sporolactobacillus shoreae]|uniref:LysR family transcriptional regulator n=1 Tax=Sporolactobacillus shoreae TaxID=1465501 RepID=A0A4Z0GI06_9BACL|nr:LysR family transcriptional regulator [Sporolactobacillus shoreae]TGA96373.1 LysR family transcriptional regulator [Sporolactobacillus shoreae]
MHYFLEVAIQKSFTKAAHHLYVTQPTISKMVKDIEDELGMILLDRSGKEVELTDAGRIVFEQSRKIVRSFDHLSDELTDLTNARRGKLTVGLPPMIGVHFFPTILGKLRVDYPGIDLHIVEYGAKKVADCVSEGSLEIGVTVGPFDRRTMDSFVFYNDPLCLAVHESSLLASKKSARIQDLRAESFILFPEEFALRGMITKSCEHAGFQPRIVFESSQWDFMIKLVSEGFGITLLPMSIVKKAKVQSVTLIPLKDESLSWRLSMVWKKNHYLSFAARTWISETQKALSLKWKKG